MHHFLETLSEFLSNWPVISGERAERKPVKDRKKISSLHYRPICKITDDKKRDNDLLKRDKAN